MDTIILADKNLKHLMHTKALLEEVFRKHMVISALNLEEVVKKISIEKPVLLVVQDNILPPENYPILNQIKKSQKNAPFGILMIFDDNVNKRIKLEALNQGVSAYVNEPLNKDEIEAHGKAILRSIHYEYNIIHENISLQRNLVSLDSKFLNSQHHLDSIYETIPIGIGIVQNDKLVNFNQNLRQTLNGNVKKNGTPVEVLIPEWFTYINELHANHKTKTLQKELTLHIKKSIKNYLLKIYPLPANEDAYIINLIDITSENLHQTTRKMLLEIYYEGNSKRSMRDFARSLNQIMVKHLKILDFTISKLNEQASHLETLFSSSGFNKKIPIQQSNTLESLVAHSKRHIWLQSNEIELLIEEEKLNPIPLIPNEWLGVPLINGNRIVGIIAIKTKGQQKQLSQEIIDILQLLSSPIASILDSKIYHQKLELALKQAKESEQLKNNFLSNISHEIRTPMNAIVGFSSILKEASSEEEREEYTNLVMENSDALLNILNDIMEIAKIDSGQIVLNTEEIELYQIIQEICEEFKATLKASQKDIEFHCIIPEFDKSTTILIDPFRLKQIITNLLSNALKFTPFGNIYFGFKFINSETINFYVKDSGIGIPENKLAMIFERFGQVEEGHAREFGGTGLGLSICKSLVGLMGGSLTVNSTLGEGSNFQFTVPTNFKKFDTPKKSMGKKKKYHWKGKKILLVDDIVSNLEFLDLLLKPTEVSIFWATNGQKAVNYVEEKKYFDLILMDIQMPEMDGYTATRIIKNIDSSIPIIAQTAFSEISNQEKAIEAGADDYLQKPINPYKLLETIDSYFK